MTLLGLSDDDVEKAVGPPHSLGTRVKEEITGALYNFLANLLVNSINQHENTASRLTKQLLVLNIILGGLTVVGVFLGVVQLCSR